MQALEQEIKELLISALQLEDLKPEDIDAEQALFVEGLGLDSIDALELVVSLEKKFGVSVPNSETAKVALANVNSIRDYVVANRK